MRRASPLFLGLLFLLHAFLSGGGLDPVRAQTITPDIIVTRPRDGEALQGVVIVEGRIRGRGLQAAEAGFAYPSESPQNWFFLTDIPLQGGSSSQQEFRFEWDTTKVTDGTYNLRIKADYVEGDEAVVMVSDLRVRNYSPVETNTPIPAGSETPTQAQPDVTPEVTDTPASPTSLPTNPVSLQRGDITRALAWGLVAVAGVFGVYGVYRLLRSRVR